MRRKDRLGRLGEDVAARFLINRGVAVLERNVRVGRGEVDLIISDGGRKAVVEVKTGSRGGHEHPRFHFTDDKAAQVRRLGRQLGIGRVDLLTVVANESGVRANWYRRV